MRRGRNLFYFLLFAFVSPVVAQVPQKDLSSLRDRFIEQRQERRQRLHVTSDLLRRQVEVGEVRLKSLLLRQGQVEANRSQYLIQREELEGQLAVFRASRRKILIAEDQSFRLSEPEVRLKELARRPHLASPAEFSRLSELIEAESKSTAPGLSELRFDKDLTRLKLNELSLDAMLQWVAALDTLDSEAYQLAADTEQTSLVHHMAQLCAENPNYAEGWRALCRALDGAYDAKIGRVAQQAMDFHFPTGKRSAELCALLSRLAVADKAANKD